MHCLALMLGVALIAAIGPTVASQSLPPPERMLSQQWNCTGWPEPRVWIEAQQWWTDAGEEADIEHTSRHFHIGACMPYGQTVSGVVTIDVLTQLHNNQDHYISEVYFLAPLPYNAVRWGPPQQRTRGGGVDTLSCGKPRHACCTSTVPAQAIC